MYILRGRNVNELWKKGVNAIASIGQIETSRAGMVRVAPCPVTSVYEHPMERVLFDPARDANPFFHFFEAIWMLAGRDDAAFLNRFVKDFGERFAEPNGTIHGAYGARWRRGLGFDQLDEVVKKLREDPTSRQCVIQMWDAMDGSDYDGHEDLRGNWRDRPCNTHLYLRVREPTWVHISSKSGAREIDYVQKFEPVLDLTVCCRSNDIIFGAYGANAVHFSVLQEYLAARIGVGVGTMYQFSNNWHAYVDVLEKYEAKRLASLTGENSTSPVYPGTYSMVQDPGTWDSDLNEFMDWIDTEVPRSYSNLWFDNVAEPMYLAHAFHKSGNKERALETCQTIAAADWRQAAVAWIQRRIK